MLSNRGTKWASMAYAHGPLDEYHPEFNPSGLVNLALAEIKLMHKVLAEFFRNIEPEEQSYAYGECYTGTVRLRRAMAAHLNNHFLPAVKFDAEEITFAAGVTSLNEACALTIADPGDAIMLDGPTYGSFNRDMTMRTQIKLETVSMSPDDQFSPACVEAFEAGYESAMSRGVNVRAIMICNPNNPTGRCYPRETLVEILQFCSRTGIHLISDEIYALSVYKRDDQACESFTSIRSIDARGIIDPASVHVLYGMSKDFGLAGLRLGCIISQNMQLTRSIRATCRFFSPSQLSMSFATKLLEDQDFVGVFLRQSREMLRNCRLFAENLLAEKGILYSRLGNAGLFIWLDLRQHLPTNDTGGNAWEAEKLLNDRFVQAGVIVSSGRSYFAPEPGYFRMIFSLDEYTIQEGIGRISTVIGLE